MGSGLWGPSGSGYRVSVGAGLENKPRKGSMVTGHPRGLARKVSYQQDIISFPHKDSSLDGEVKCADSSALALGLGGGGEVGQSLSRSPGGKQGKLRLNRRLSRGFTALAILNGARKLICCHEQKRENFHSHSNHFQHSLPDHFCCSFRL